MNSVILIAATRLIFPLLLMFSVIVTLNGHNLPGGGFVGGLMAASALALHSMAFNAGATRQLLRVSPIALIGVGLSLALMSGLISLLAPAFGGADHAFMTGLWTSFDAPGIGPLKIGTPLLFDLGVYFTVLGVTLVMVLTLEEEC
jgi:multicomponent Na+:H+ antiporter subunit B